MQYSMDLLNHIRAINSCAAQLGFEARIDARNCALEIAKGELSVLFQPRFFYVDPEKRQRNIAYYLRPEVRGFIGWLPYFNKTWPEALDKIAFKTRCRERGLRTPDWWTTAPAGLCDFLIKRRSGSLGVGMRGPYRAPDRANPYHQLVEGEFYERFVEGRIAKIWYWNAQPVCVDLVDCPQVTGDGRSSVRQLIAARCEITMGESAQFAQMALIEPVVLYQGKTLDSVLSAGEKVACSFRYASVTELPTLRNRNALELLRNTPLGHHLGALGRSLWEFVPEEIRRGVLFTVDAVLDAQSELWLLEMNPNPGIHPDCYPAMIASILAGEVSQLPSLEKNIADAPYMKGGLVWAPPAAPEKRPSTVPAK